MKKPFPLTVSAILGTFLVATVALTAAEPKSATKKSKRPLTVAHWMDGVVRFHYTGLRRALDNGPGPSDDKGWKRLEMNAAILNETSYVLMADGRSRDEVWKKAASKTLREGSASLLAAINKKDVASAKTTLKQMGQACVSCHKVHRPD